MADIFTPWKMQNLELANRLVRSATWEAMGEPDGTPHHRPGQPSGRSGRGRGWA